MGLEVRPTFTFGIGLGTRDKGAVEDPRKSFGYVAGRSICMSGRGKDSRISKTTAISALLAILYIWEGKRFEDFEHHSPTRLSSQFSRGHRSIGASGAVKYSICC